jgi:predicted SnoaL-like aldol condensation-catalyzing enzyme
MKQMITGMMMLFSQIAFSQANHKLTTMEANKAIVKRFNKEVIEQGNVESFKELIDPAFINHSAPAGADNGPAGMIHTFNNVLRPAMPDMKVIIYSQVAEGDLVTTRKSITGTQTGTLLGIPPSGKQLTIDVIDIVRIKDGKYFEHWGINTLPAVLASLK